MRAIFLTATLVSWVMPAAAQEQHEHPDCPDPGMAFWFYPVDHWHYPEIVAELTQQNGPRSRAELDTVARELVRSAVDPDPDWVVEQVRTHFEGDIRAGAEAAAAEEICYDGRDVDRMVTEALERVRQDPGDDARMMARETLVMASHRGWRSSEHPPNAGIPFDGDGAFEAALLMFEETGSDAGLLDELNPERAAAVFERWALRPGLLACKALDRLRRWYRWDSIADDDERYGRPHPSYERLRRWSPESCPELDDPGGG